ncbi:MAG: aromatic ring-hydroxylating dioxygenase subunit alpha [Thermoleophilaceae bacterium]|nr:aromatic ring-hydroxylating dioxygenase subunit alpha [Thermoleophilaceae bacterium]
MDRALADVSVETTPYSWYVDPAVLAAERDRIFRRTWQYAGHTGDLDGPGSFFPTQAGGFPVIVALDNDGELRGHLNICRHRGTILVDEPQRRGTIQCPYHAWTYGLDGSLRGAPRSKDEPGFDKEELGLAPVSVDTWGPFVFVNPDPDAAPLADTLGDLPAVVAANGLDVDALRFHHRTSYSINANWKIAIENYLECYHCQLNHPDLMKVIDEESQRHEASGLRLSQFPPVHPEALNGSAPYDISDGVPTAQYHILFPAMKFNVNPGRPNLSIGPMWPTAVDRTEAWFDYFFVDGVDETWIAQMLEFDNQVGSEDTALVEAVQRGAGSGGLTHGRLLARTEVLIGAFQQLVRDRLA